MRRFVLLLSMLLLFPLISKAEDGVKFFDGYKHGWGPNFFFVDISKNGHYIYNGRDYVKRYFDVDNFKEISWEEFNNEIRPIGEYIYIKNNLAIINFRTNENEGEIENYHKPYGVLNSGAFSMVFTFNISMDSKIALIKGIKEKKYVVDWKYQRVEISSKFEFDPKTRVLEDGRLLIAGQNEPYLYVIDKGKKDKIFYGNGLFYAPMRYLAKIWGSMNECPKLPLITTSDLKSDVNQINQCFEAIFRKHPKGEFNVKYPDTPNFQQFNREFDGFE